MAKNKVEPAFTHQTVEQIRKMQNEFMMTPVYPSKFIQGKRYNVYFKKERMYCYVAKENEDCLNCGMSLLGTQKQKYCSDECRRIKVRHVQR